MQPLVIDHVTIQARAIVKLPEAPARPARQTALQFSGQNVLDRRVLERELGRHAFEPGVLRFQIFPSLELRDRHAAVLASPVKRVARLIRYLRVSSSIEMPASPSFKIATICDSVNLDFLVDYPDPVRVSHRLLYKSYDHTHCIIFNQSVRTAPPASPV